MSLQSVTGEMSFCPRPAICHRESVCQSRDVQIEASSPHHSSLCSHPQTDWIFEHLSLDCSVVALSDCCKVFSSDDTDPRSHRKSWSPKKPVVFRSSSPLMKTRQPAVPKSNVSVNRSQLACPCTPPVVECNVETGNVPLSLGSLFRH